MAIQDFTAGQVLTALQMDNLQANDYNQTVSTKTASYTLVAADKGTRVVMNSASATTITVNTSLFSAGDTLVLQNISTGVCTITAGTATVSTAGSLAIPQNGSGTLYFTSAGVSIYYPSAGAATSSGLTLVSTTTIGTTVSSVTVSSAFSATYDNYLILISNSVSSATGYVGLKFGAAATNYYGTSVSVNLGGTVAGASDNNAAALLKAVQAATTSFNAVINVNSPFLSTQTYVSANSFTDNSNYFSGKLADSSSYTAFTLTPASGTLTGGTIKVYGYSNS